MRRLLGNARGSIGAGQPSSEVLRRLELQEQGLERQRERLDRHRDRLARQHERLMELEREVGRLSPQVAALEVRLAEVAARDERWAAADGDELVEARSLVQEIRAEHARIRARISAAARFEERLRVVEDALTPVAGAPGESVPVESRNDDAAM